MRRDEAERTVWVGRYRNSKETLGEVTKHCLTTRAAMWEIPLPVGWPPREERKIRRLGRPPSGSRRSLEEAAGREPKVLKHQTPRPYATPWIAPVPQLQRRQLHKEGMHLRPVHLLRAFLLRVLESNFPGDPL